MKGKQEANYYMNHPTDLLEAHALQILSPETAAEVDAHLTTCPACQEELAQVTTTFALLSYAAPMEPPPSAMEDRLFAKIASLRAEDQQQNKGVELAPSEIDSVVPVTMQPVPVPLPVADNKSRITSLPLYRQQRLPRVALIASIAAVFLVGFFVVRQIGGSTVTGPVTLRQQAITALHAQGTTQTFVLGATENGPHTATGVVAIDTSTGKGVVIVTHLDLLPANKTYEFWLVHTGNKGQEPVTIPNGTFTVDASGKGVYHFTSTGPVNTISNVGVSLERTGGVTVPDSPMLMLVVG